MAGRIEEIKLILWFPSLITLRNFMWEPLRLEYLKDSMLILTMKLGRNYKSKGQEGLVRTRNRIVRGHIVTNTINETSFWFLSEKNKYASYISSHSDSCLNGIVLLLPLVSYIHPKIAVQFAMPRILRSLHDLKDESALTVPISKDFILANLWGWTKKLSRHP